MAACRSRRSWRPCSPPASPPSGASRRRPTVPFTPAPAIAGACITSRTSGASTLVWTADQPEVFAVAVDPTGVLYAATSPDGKVYRIENGKATEFFAPQGQVHLVARIRARMEACLWAPAIRAISIASIRPGNPRLYYETGQSHVTALAFDSHGNVLAGTEPNGILYRISAKDKAFVLYNASLPEIRSIVPMPGRHHLRRGLGGSVANRTAPLTTSLGSSSAAASRSRRPTIHHGHRFRPTRKPTPTSNPRPTLQGQPRSRCSKPRHCDQSADRDSRASTNRRSTRSIPTPRWRRVELEGRKRLQPGWRSPNGCAGISPPTRRAASTGWAPDRKATLMVETNEGEATRLLDSPDGLVAATGDMGKLFRLADVGGRERQPTNRPCTIRVRWRAGAGSPGAATGGKVQFATRSGNSARPDNTWSDWSAAAHRSAGFASIRSPNARYIQWRAELTARARASRTSASPICRRTIRRWSAASTSPCRRARARRRKPLPPAPPRRAYSITVTDTGDTSTPAGTPTQTLSHGSGSQMQVTWQADDPDGDRLVYSALFPRRRRDANGSCCARISRKIRCCWMATFWPTAATISA